MHLELTAVQWILLASSDRVCCLQRIRLLPMHKQLVLFRWNLYCTFAELHQLQWLHLQLLCTWLLGIEQFELCGCGMSDVVGTSWSMYFVFTWILNV